MTDPPERMWGRYRCGCCGTYWGAKYMIRDVCVACLHTVFVAKASTRRAKTSA